MKRDFLQRHVVVRQRVNSFKLKFNLKEGRFRLDIQKKLFTVKLEQHAHFLYPLHCSSYSFTSSLKAQLKNSEDFTVSTVTNPTSLRVTFVLYGSVCCYPNLCSPVGGLNPHLLIAHLPVNRVKFILVEKPVGYL